MFGHAKIQSLVLLTMLLVTMLGLAAWKRSALDAVAAAAMSQPEPVEFVSSATAFADEYVPSTTAIGTVVARRSITLRNELAGTVRTAALEPGKIVEAGTVLVALDVSVEQAELEANRAQAKLAASVLERVEALHRDRAVSAEELDRATADLEIAQAAVARTRAIIERKTIRAPFRARIGLSDVHPGQYLHEGTQLTTLQGIDDTSYVDFTVEQQVASRLGAGDRVRVIVTNGKEHVYDAEIVAVDARVDSLTRNALVRASIFNHDPSAAPGASVRVLVPTGVARSIVTIPASAVRKSPQGDHVFVLAEDETGNPRASLRPVHVLSMNGNEAVIDDGLDAGELVATAGSFKLRPDVRVALVDSTNQLASGSL
ncbi:MAG: efflux RND transporter periplasmic adaptor subunit [Woeseiaceae bacterium]|nr:efflux RND transporter periplasmic adaptor subunit [Woeseiaceae bacterium]